MSRGAVDGRVCTPKLSPLSAHACLSGADTWAQQQGQDDTADGPCSAHLENMCGIRGRMLQVAPHIRALLVP